MTKATIHATSINLYVVLMVNLYPENWKHMQIRRSKVMKTRVKTDASDDRVEMNPQNFGGKQRLGNKRYSLHTDPT